MHQVAGSPRAAPPSLYLRVGFSAMRPPATVPPPAPAGYPPDQKRREPPMSHTATIRRSVVLKRRPDGAPRREDFQIREDAIPLPAAGEVVTRTVWLSIDPYMRGRLREQQTYAQPINPGDVMTGETVGEAIASAHVAFPPGGVGVRARGWQTHSVTPGEQLVKLPRRGVPLSAYLGVLGMP